MKNPVHEIVEVFFKLKGIDQLPKEILKKKYPFPRYAHEAKLLLEACGGNVDDAMWALSKMEYKAKSRKFDWTISTCLKSDLRNFGL